MVWPWCFLLAGCSFREGDHVGCHAIWCLSVSLCEASLQDGFWQKASNKNCHLDLVFMCKESLFIIIHMSICFFLGIIRMICGPSKWILPYWPHWSGFWTWFLCPTKTWPQRERLRRGSLHLDREFLMAILRTKGLLGRYSGWFRWQSSPELCSDYEFLLAMMEEESLCFGFIESQCESRE